MKRLLSFSISILVILVLCIACSEENESQLSIQPVSFNFMRGANSDILVLSNVGSGELSWEISDIPDWLEVSKSSGRITSGNDPVTLTANIDQVFGQYSGTLSITSNGGNKEVSISLDINAWKKVKDMPSAKMGHSSCVLDGKIYAIGGSPSTLSNPAKKGLAVYDPFQDTWITKTSMSEGRANLATCVVNEMIYAIGGGQNFYDSPLKTIEKYDPENDIWTPQSDMPRARIGLVVAVVDGKMYIIGGADADETPIAEVDIYDPATNSWTTGTQLPTPRSHLAASVLNGEIYTMGGTFGPSANYDGLRKVEVYKPATNAWTTKADIITGRRYISACTLNGRVYLFGGTSGNGQDSFQSVEEYDPATDTWTANIDMPDPAAGISAVTLNDKIYVSGGAPVYPPEVVKAMYEYSGL